ncbi:MAG: YwaF family protein [Oscillospiraceae bacterium]|nr:YwaF family protein [Oscillospiraceae bacterium]
MEFLTNLLKLLNMQMETPTCYGLFHITFFAAMLLATVYICVFRKNDSAKTVRKAVFTVSLIVLILEIYKQINFSFTFPEEGLKFEYAWYAFPFQFCSTPMYAGILAGIIKKGKVHDALCAYLATFSVFAGLCVMVYPGDVFTGTVGINIQTMVCHGSMLPIGAYLLSTGHVKLEHKTVLKALCVFAAAVGIATVMNEIAHATGLLEANAFNMFYISPYCDPHLPVYSEVQKVVPYPWSLVIYIAGFTAAAYIILLAAMGIHRLAAGKKKITAAAAVN